MRFDLKTLFNRDIIMLGSGVVSSTLLSNAVLNSAWVRNMSFGFLNTTWGQVTARLLIPFAGGMVLNNFMPAARQFSRGLIIGGMANAVGTAIDAMQGTFGFSIPGASAEGTSEYFPALSTPRKLNRNGGVNALSAGPYTPGYSAHNTFGMSGIYDGESAFATDAWAVN